MKELSNLDGVTMLELVQNDEGAIELRPAKAGEEALVSIQFSDKIKDALGDDVKGIGQQMINAAIHHVMGQQLARWHANVLDEEPVHFS